MAKSRPEPELQLAEVQKEPEPKLPAGVQMVEAIRRGSGGPPSGWKGSWQMCSGCGDFIESHCPKCSPSSVVSNIAMTMQPKVLA